MKIVVGTDTFRFCGECQKHTCHQIRETEEERWVDRVLICMKCGRRTEKRQAKTPVPQYAHV